MTELKEKIKVLGIGTSGCNAVNYMIDSGLTNVEFWAINTDSQLLELSKSPRKLQLGVKTTKGLGACGNPKIGFEAACESKEDIEVVLSGADMIFIVSGMGGGTGSGAAPEIAAIAKSKNILTVGIVTKPFKFEGKKRIEKADSSIEKLKENVDSLIVIENEKIIETIKKDRGTKDAYSVVDEILKNVIESIVDTITIQSPIQEVSFEDIKDILTKSGLATVGIGRAKGENKVKEACKLAIESQLSDFSIKYASRIILNVLCSPNTELSDIKKAIDNVLYGISDETRVILGCVVDDNLKDEIQIVIIGTNFDKKYIDKVKSLKSQMEEELIEIRSKYYDEIKTLEEKCADEVQKAKNKYRKELEN